LPNEILEPTPKPEPHPVDRDTVVSDICAACQEVFATMLGVEVTAGEPYVQKNVPGSAEGVMSMIGLAGPWTGAGSIVCSAECACKLASFLLMTEYPAINDEVLDAVAELTNMIVGSFKTLIEPRTGPLGLSIPSVVYGRNFTVRNGTSDEWTVIPFYCGEHQLEIRTCLMRTREPMRASIAAAV
jgi:chemotaxis protein CheX